MCVTTQEYMHNKFMYFFFWGGGGDLLLILSLHQHGAVQMALEAPSVLPDCCTVTSRPIASIVGAARLRQCPRTHACSTKINYFFSPRVVGVLYEVKGKPCVRTVCPSLRRKPASSDEMPWIIGKLWTEVLHKNLSIIYEFCGKSFQ